MKKRSSFSGSLGFVLAAAGSAVGLGNIWRFPYLAARDGGGLFIVVYLVLAVTFGFALLTTEVAIGRKTKQSPLTAYYRMRPKKIWKGLGVLGCLVPFIILPYYCVIGGWVLKYFIAFVSGHGSETAQDTYFTDFISHESEPVIMMFIFLAVIAFIIYRGVKGGIELSSKILMPILLVLVVGIAVYSLTISHTGADGVTKTGLDGLKVLLIPNLDGIGLKELLMTVVDAMGQLFFSLSVAMGIMIAYGSYVSDDASLTRSINQIEIFDTVVALLAGTMIIPAVYVFMGTEGMDKGPSLMFVSLPKIFAEMGTVGNIVGALFFAMVLFAAITSGMSVLEAVVSSLIDQFHISRRKATIIESLIALGLAIIVCLGYNIFYFEAPLPNGTTAQILDIFDYVSNSVLMPVIAIATCILIGWILGPQSVTDEVEKTGEKMGRKRAYIIMVKYVAPALLAVLFIQSFIEF